MIGSPGLSHLCMGLEKENQRSASIPPLFLDTSDSGESPCISKSEIQNGLHNCHKMAIEDSYPLPPPEDTKHSIVVDTATKQHPQYRDPKAIFFGNTSPLMTEIYAFPPARSVRCKTFTTGLNKWRFLKAQETELELKFPKLEQQFKIDHQGVRETMEKLADVRYKLYKDKEADLMDRKLLDFQIKTWGFMDIRTMKASLNLIYSLVRQGRYSEAQSLNDRLYPAVLKLVRPCDPLAIMILEKNAQIAWELGQVENSERLRRQLLQIQLISNAPRHLNTIQAMVYVGHALARQGTKGGETLLRIAIQLALNDPLGADEKRCEAMRDLVDVTYTHREFKESSSIATKATDMFMLKLGPKHPNFLRMQFGLACSMMQLGELVESEKLLRQMSDNSKEWNQPILVDASQALGMFLWKTRRLEDAVTWYEKAFAGRRTWLGQHHLLTRATCHRLARYYKKQGRYGDALELFDQMINKIRESGANLTREIEELQLKILRLKEEMEQRDQRTSSSSINDDKDSEYRLYSYDRELDEDEDDKPDGGVCQWFPQGSILGWKRL